MRKRTLERLYRNLSEDFCCDVEQLKKPGLYITKFEERKGRRKFPVSDRHFSIISINDSIVICADKGKINWCEENYKKMGKIDFFSFQNLSYIEDKLKMKGNSLKGPGLKFVCETVQTGKPLSNEYIVDIYYKDDIHKLYKQKSFENALTYDENLKRDDEIAISVKYNKKIIGIAGVSSDSEDMWQIGLDVLEKYRDMGIGKFLLNQITKNVIKKKKIPYYSTSVWNIPSINLALYSGYKLYWLEYYSK